MLRQLYGSLSAKLYNRSVGLFDVNDSFNILIGKRLKVQLVCNVKVGGYGLRIVVDDYCFISGFSKCPCGMYRAVIELYSLSDPYRSGTEYEYFFLSLGLSGFVLSAVYGIIIRGGRIKFRSAGINYLVDRSDAFFSSERKDLLFLFAGKTPEISSK